VYSGEAYTFPDGQSPADDFHTYAIEWEQGEIRWYVDGDHYATQTQNGWFSQFALDNPEAPFDQYFHLILNLAVGGDWAAKVNAEGIDESVFPQEMVVDYVRVYKCQKDPLTGKGCATTDSAFVLNPGNLPPDPVNNQGNNIIFDGSLSDPYQWHTYTTNGQVEYQIEHADSEHQNVATISFNTTDGIGFFQSPEGVDLSNFASMSFEWRVLVDPAGESNTYHFRADCTYPCTSGDIPLTAAPTNNWQQTSLLLKDLAQAGLNLNAVNTPFILYPAAKTEGVIIQVDNIILH